MELDHYTIYNVPSVKYEEWSIECEGRSNKYEIESVKWKYRL